MCPVILGQPPAPTPHPPFPRDWRRRSADVGGLHLATSGAGQGQGWLGGEPAEIETIYAELLSDMYTETVNSVNDNSLQSTPTDLPESVRSRLIHSLDRWHFEPHRLPDEELIECTLILFEALFRVEGMQDAIPLSMQQLAAFIHHLRRIYRYENTYHNFEHALDVLQAVQSYLKSAGMVPSVRILLEPNRTWRPQKSFDSGSLVASLGLRELFTLYIAAIGHDVGHPGFTNIFMKNVQAPLSLVFDHHSALENMHCQLLLRVMRHHGLGVLLDEPVHGAHIRKILLQSVLATDMSVHKDFMERLQKTIDGESGSLCQRQIIICQAILKNADISNPTRPYNVSRHWANALMQEWIAQANLEEELNMKPTVSNSDDPLSEAEGQIFFISEFAKPLLDKTEKVMPEMSMYRKVCKNNLDSWKKRKVDLKPQSSGTSSRTTSAQSSPLATFSSPPSSVSPSPPPPPSSSASSVSVVSPLPPPTSPRLSDYYSTAFPLTLPKPTSEHHYTPSSYVQSESDSIATPDSPTESESVSSSMFSPISDSSSSNRCPSSGSGSLSATSSAAYVPTLHEGIRIASKIGSIRQKKSKKDARNSWCVSGLGGSFASVFQPPPPASAPMLLAPNGLNGSNTATPKAKTSSAYSLNTSPPTPLHAPPLSLPGGGLMMPRLQVTP